MMATTKRRSINESFQSILIKLSEILNIPTHKRGVCYGFALMSIFAALAEDLDNFQKRLTKIARLAHDNSPEFTNLLDIASTAPPDKLLPFTLPQTETSKNYFEYQDIESFLVGINALNYPRNFSDLFATKTPLKQKDALSYFDFFKPKALEAPDKVIHQSKVWTGCYTYEEIKIFCKKIASLTSTQPISLLVSNHDHAISLTYTPSNAPERQWTIIDANRGFIDCAIGKVGDHIFASLAQEPSSPYLSYSIIAFHTGSLEITLDDLNAKAVVDEEWIEIHQVNHDKAKNHEWLILAIGESDHQALLALLEHEANPNQFCYFGPVICLAVALGDLKSTQLLLKFGANPASPNEDKETSPLWRAASAGHANIIKELCAHGYAIPAEEYHWALHIAVEKGHLDVIRELFEQGVDININQNNDSLLYTAVEQGHFEVVKGLLEIGAGTNSLKNDGHSPFWVAMTALSTTDEPTQKQNYLKIITLLLGSENVKISPKLAKMLLNKEEIRSHIEKQAEAEKLLDKLKNAKSLKTAITFWSTSAAISLSTEETEKLKLS